MASFGCMRDTCSAKDRKKLLAVRRQQEVHCLKCSLLAVKTAAVLRQ